jgi:outer membrane murein-binding lipoprotein Lpp
VTERSGDRVSARIDELDAALTRLTADVDVLGLALQGAGMERRASG